MAPAHSPVAPKRLEDYWRKEAEHQARIVRYLEGLLIFERNRKRWTWCVGGLFLGALIGWCLAVWRLN